VLFIDAIHVKVRDSQVTNRPFYVVIGVTVDGHRDILGIWAGDGGEGAKYWLHVLTEIKNRGVADACIVVCDGLKGLPESITTVWSQALVQACVLHLIRNTFRYASRRYWEQMAKDLRAGLHRTHLKSRSARCAHLGIGSSPGARSPCVIRRGFDRAAP
jgi:putative transposase